MTFVTNPPPQPTSPMVDPKTGRISKEWMRFILYFFSNSDQVQQMVVDQTAAINSLNASVTALNSSVQTLNFLIQELFSFSNTDSAYSFREKTLLDNFSEFKPPDINVLEYFSNITFPRNNLMELFTSIVRNNREIQENYSVEINNYSSDPFLSGGGYFLSIQSGDSTPEIFGSAVAGVSTYLSQIGKWVRIEGWVKFYFDVDVDVFDVTTSGVLKISGLPVPILEDTKGEIISYHGISLPAGSSDIFISGVSTESSVSIKYSGNSSSYVSSNASDVVGSLSISGVITYRG